MIAKTLQRAELCAKQVTRTDPALPGDPFSRLSYRFGQLLGATDFSLEQRGHLLRHRLHQAATHGTGTVWGLRVGYDDIPYPGGADKGGMLYVCPGLAIDALGRDLYIPDRQCLDIRGLVNQPKFWSKFELLPRRADIRRAYIVLRYQSCLSEPAPAVARPCADEDVGMSFTRITDGASIELESRPPPSHPLLRDWLSRFDTKGRQPMRSLREDLLHALMDEPRERFDEFCDQQSIAEVWQEQTDAPVLLAEVEIEEKRTAAQVWGKVNAVRNEVRPLLPPLQLLAEHLFGMRLARLEPSDALQAERLETTRDTEAPSTTLVVHFTQPLLPGSEQSAVHLSRFTPSTGWDERPVKLTVEERTLSIVVEGEAWTEDTLYQLMLVGAGLHPLLGENHQPFAGWIDENLSASGQGATSSLIGTWPPHSEEP